MQTDNVQLKARYEGARAGIEDGLVKAVNAELLQRTGLKPGAVNYSPDSRYTVTAHGLQGGKPTAQTYTGTSTEGIEAALKDAAKMGTVDLDLTALNVEVERIAAAPFFTVPIVSRSLRRERVGEYQEAAVGHLADTYGPRLRRNPDSIEYRVVRLRDAYDSDGILPKGQFTADRIIAQGQSNKSMDDAYTKSRQFKLRHTKSTIFEQTARVMVYGAAEAGLTVSQQGVASPMVATGTGKPMVLHDETTGKGRVQGPEPARAPAMSSGRGHSSGRGASPAAKDPVALGSPNNLM